MKVLQINSVMDYGSTGRITRDLYDTLESQGHDCVIAFGRGDSTPGYKTIKIGSNFDQLLHGAYSRLTDRHGFGSILATKKFIKQIDEYNPDIIQLHNIHGYYINIKILFEYLSQKDIPIVWLLHDQWTVSGHGASFELNSDGTFPDELSNRKLLSEYPKTIGVSQFEKNLRDKESLFTSIENMTIITPSNWLTNMMKKSFFKKYEIKTIHNGVDTGVFYVDNSITNFLRQKWEATNKTIILGIASVWNERKGLNDFVKLSKLLPDEEYQIILVGIDDQTKAKLPDNIITIERTNSVDELRSIYNTCDIFVNPTYFDNFPTVNIEALACGTPVITYNTGGSPESIDKYTGSIVNQGDVESLIFEIKKWARKTPDVANACRNKLLQYFTKKISNDKYEQLYRKISQVHNPV